MTQTPHDRSVARTTSIVIAVVLVVAFGLLVVYEIRRVLVWIAIAAFFAVATTPAAGWLERHLRWCRRWLATLIVFVALLAVLAGLVTLFVLPLVREGSEFVQQLPQMVRDARAGRGPVGSLLNRYHIVQWAEQHREQVQTYVTGLGSTTVSLVRVAATTILAVLTIFVLSYLMVLQGPRLVGGLVSAFPTHVAMRIQRVAHQCARSITGYITGNLLISIVCGTLTYVVLLVVGVPFAGLIALFVAIADLIPLVGATLGAVVAVLAALVTSVPAAIIVLVFFVVYQQAENHLLQPIILSRTVKLNPLTVLVSILIGVELAGILGALLAIPVASTIQIVASDLWSNRRTSNAEPVD